MAVSFAFLASIFSARHPRETLYILARQARGLGFSDICSASIHFYFHGVFGLTHEPQPPLKVAAYHQTFQRQIGIS